jgi:hypothetical protein
MLVAASLLHSSRGMCGGKGREGGLGETSGVRFWIKFVLPFQQRLGHLLNTIHFVVNISNQNY